MGKFLELLKVSKLFSKQQQPQAPEEVKSLKYNLITVIALAFVSLLLHILISYQKSLPERPPQIIYYAEPLLVALIGITSGWYVNYLFLKHRGVHEQKEKDRKGLKEKFKIFFGSTGVQESDPEILQNTTIVLPGYHTARNQEKELERVESEIKIDIQNSLDGIGSRKSIKNFYRESEAISFAQSDTIASMVIIAHYAKMEMTLPTIRTDDQGLLKFELNAKNIMRAAPETLDQIAADASRNSKTTSKGKPMKERLRSTSNRIYQTYFAVGMYSNDFLMNMINNSDDPELEKNKHFVVYNKLDEKNEIVRVITIRDNSGNLGTDFSTPIGLKGSNLDYGLVAYVKFKDRKIFISAGVTALGTECATRYLMGNWEKISSLSQGKCFALLIEVRQDENNSPNYVIAKAPLKAYPSSLYGLNTTSE